MAITERQKDILQAIVRIYIKDAQPVGSKTLAQTHDFGIGPAMIRQEMGALEKEGYIAQPHTSAGRVPTDKAYRLYISELEKQKQADRLTEREERMVRKGIGGQTDSDVRNLLRDLSRVVADISGELSVSGLEDGRARYVHGFSQLSREPELREGQELINLFRFMDEMDAYFDKVWQEALEGSFGVLIGEENPLKEVQNFSVITGRYLLPHGGAGFISIVGPTRMDYRKNVALVRYVTRQLENSQ